MVHGIYAGDARALSVRACFPAFYEMEQRAGSLIRAALRPGPPPAPLPTAAPTDQPAARPEWVAQVTKASMLALRDGLETLVHALVRHLQADGRVDLRLGQRAAALAPTADGRVAVRPAGRACAAARLRAPTACVPRRIRPTQVTTSDGATLVADHVVSALPPPALARLLEPSAAPADAAIRQDLAAVAAVDVAVVNLNYDRRVMPFEGFGYLVPSWEPSDVLGVIFDSSAFPGQSRCVPTPQGGGAVRASAHAPAGRSH